MVRLILQSTSVSILTFLTPGREFLLPQNQVYVSLNESEIRIKQCKWMFKPYFFSFGLRLGTRAIRIATPEGKLDDPGHL